MNWWGLAKKASQDGWTDVFGDVQRHSMDAYRCQVFQTKTSSKITITVTVSHDMFGLQVFQDFWKYDLNDAAAAASTFKQVKAEVKDIFDDYESNEIPNNMLHIAIREAVRHIDPDHKPSTRVPWIDEAKKHDGEKDWRSSIYGTRYPKTEGF